MDISILGYKFNLEVLILIGVVYLILVGHTFCGCSNYGLMEGFEKLKENVSGDSSSSSNKDSSEEDSQASKLKKLKMMQNLSTQQSAGSSEDSSTEKELPTRKEGFTGANINYGESSVYDLNNNDVVDTSKWSAQDMTITPGKPLSAGVKAFEARPKQQIPLPEGEMLLFANTEFKPEYCPNTYSTSTGCAGMTEGQLVFLKNRGGNNVPYSEY
jgi:hypothetical protein